MSTSAAADDLDALEPRHVQCTDEDLTVTLADGRRMTTPLWCYPRLLDATPEQRASYELSPFGIRWPEIDEDLSVAAMLRGAKGPGAEAPQRS